MPHITPSERTKVKMIPLEEMELPDSLARAIDSFVDAQVIASPGFDVSTAATDRYPFQQNQSSF